MISMIDYVLLGFLMEKGMSGYDMKQKMQLRTSFFYNTSYGSIYPSLKKMESNNWIKSEESTEDGKFKKIYIILEKGKDEFLKWLDMPLEVTNAKVYFLVRIFFYEYLPKEKAIIHLEEFVGRIQDAIAKLEKLECRSKINNSGSYKISIREFGIDYYRFILEWFKKQLNQIKKE